MSKNKKRIPKRALERHSPGVIAHAEPNGNPPIPPAPEPDSSGIDFFSKIADSPGADYESRLRALAEGWLLCTKCDFVWLWQHNRAIGLWQLIGHASTQRGATKDLPRTKFLDLNNSVTEYASRTRRPIMVPDIKSWETVLDGEKYRISATGELQRLGVESFCTIPLLPALTADEKLQARHTDLAICCHYHTKRNALPISERLLLLKGKISYFVIQSATSDNCHRIITDLHAISAPFISGTPQEAAIARRDYAEKVLEYCKGHLGFVYGSIFVADRSDEYLECVATTGLFDEQDKKLSADDVHEATYLPDEGRTGKVFKSGKVKASTIALDKTAAMGKFREIPRSLQDSAIPWLIYPIFASDPHATAQDEKIRCVGVLRWTGIGTPENPALRELTPFDIANIDCVCSYIGVIFTVLTNNITRDEQVASVKHDIGAPLVAALNSAFAVERHADNLVSKLSTILLSSEDRLELDTTQQILRNRVRDISAAVSISLLLIPELDRNPTEKLRLTLREVRLEADIIAPLSVSFRHYAYEEKSMEISFLGFSAFPTMKLDRFEMWRAIGNLLMNAIKYGNEGSKISVVGTNLRERRAYAIAVQNYGIGVKEADKEKIFKGRYRSPEAQNEATGEGLGLKIASRIVHLHGGTLELSKLDDPTTFSILLPKRLVC